MDAFTQLANAAMPDFASTTGYSMMDYAVYGKTLVTEFIAGPIVFVMYNQKWVIAWGVILIIVAFGFRFLIFFRGPFMKL